MTSTYNTSTTYTLIDKGVPIYWLDGAKVADDYENFYDGTWDEEVTLKDESGNTVTATSSTRVWTGSNHNGTETDVERRQPFSGRDPECQSWKTESQRQQQWADRQRHRLATN